MQTTKEDPGGLRGCPMEPHERRAAMELARTQLADAKVPRISVITRVGAAYGGALAAARAVCGMRYYPERPDLETFLDAGTQLGLAEAWRAAALEQTKRYNHETRLACMGEDVPNEVDAARAVRWAEKIYKAAEGHLKKIDGGLF